MDEKRFFSKVNKADASGCWIWTANKNNKGYGMFRPGGLEPKRLAHRLIFEHVNGPIPSSKIVMHTCDNPACVNPDHLCLGTQADNMTDKEGKDRGGHPKKIPDNQVPLIKAACASGACTRQLAAQHGVTERYIRRIRDGDRRAKSTP